MVGDASGVAVFVDESAASGLAMDRLAWPDLADGGVGVVGGVLVERAVGPMVGPMRVVVLDVLGEESFELAAVPDDGAIQRFVARCPDSPLGERVRLGCSRRDLDHRDPGAGEHVVELGGDLVGEPDQFAVDAAVPPCRVLTGELDDGLAHFGIDGWASRPARRRLGPVAGGEAAMPCEHGRRFHDQEHVRESSLVGRSGERGEDGAVGVAEPGPGDLALQDCEWVAQREDLGVTGGRVRWSV